MLNFSELVTEVRDEIRGGSDVDTAIAEVAADYDADIAVLRARFERAFPNGVPAAIDMTAKVQAEVDRLCKKHGIDQDTLLPAILTTVGRKVIAIAREGRDVLAVDTATAQVRVMGPGCFSGAALRLAGI